MARLLVSFVLASAALAAPGNVCSQKPYSALLTLSKNCFAESYCSSAYPVAPVTVTHSTVTTTSTVGVVTTSTITATTTSTAFATSTTSATGTTTSTLTETDTETDTATTTTTSTTTSVVASSTTTIVTNANGATYKRDAGAEPMMTPMAALEARATGAGMHGLSVNTRAQSASKSWASWHNTNSALRSTISTVCSCIETPKTLSATKTSTVTTTSTSTLSTTTTTTSTTTSTNTQTNIGTETDYATLTTTTTTTTTSTETDISTATVAAVAFNACGQNYNAPISSVPVGTRCGQNVSGSPSLRSTQMVASFYACSVLADEDVASNSYAFQFSTSTCYIYSNPNGNAIYTANTDYAYSYYYP